MEPFDRLVPLLVDAIPEAIASRKIPQRICSLRIYYYYTHAPHTYLVLRTVSEELRARVVADRGRDAPFTLWSSGEECGEPQAEIPQRLPWYRLASSRDRQIRRLCGQVYRLLGEDEDEHMPPFREALQRVALELNAKDWSGITPVTDDFVVIPADGEQFFADDLEDIVRSVPPARLDHLRSRGFLGEGDVWDQVRPSPAQGG